VVCPAMRSNITHRDLKLENLLLLTRADTC
jgi:hypothetical protein